MQLHHMYYHLVNYWHGRYAKVNPHKLPLTSRNSLTTLTADSTVTGTEFNIHTFQTLGVIGHVTMSSQQN